MNLAREPTITDEYFVTAHQIFDCCGVESTSTLSVDSLMDKFAPFVKANKAEYSYLKTLLDPEQSNPEINVTKLANALHQYSESQKTKMDLDESFNLSSCRAPQDSDSGISTDGLQLLEDLQCELKEKEHLAHQLRKQLDFTDRQHEETTAALTAERDSLRRHLNMVREENVSLSHVRRDYEEACERVGSGAAALDDARRELEGLRRSARVSRDQLAALEADKLSLQELLSKSKDECHRINEMYAARQSALLEENETLKSQHADLSSRLQDQDEFLQQVIKEKVLLEMELKDMLNKSNQNLLRLDRSIDISYTEEQMLTALDSLTADSRFSTENRILDDDSFMNALRDDQGRVTNMSIFDEIRMSFNMSRPNLTEFTSHLDKFGLNNSIVTAATQTEEFEPYIVADKNFNSLNTQQNVTTATQTEIKPYADIVKDNNSLIKTTTSTQTDESEDRLCPDGNNDGNRLKACAETQTDETEPCDGLNKVYVKAIMTDLETQTDLAIDMVKNEVVNIHKTELEMHTDSVNDIELYSGEDNAQNFKKCASVSRKLDFDTSSQEGPKSIEVQKEHCSTENNVQFSDAKAFTNIGTQTAGQFIRKPPKFIKQAQKLNKLLKSKDKYQTAETQTDEIELCGNNNNTHCTKCPECDSTNTYTKKLERDVQYSNIIVKEMQEKISEYETNLGCLEKLIGERKGTNETQQALVDDLRSKIEVLESVCETQRDAIFKITSTDSGSVQSQTEFDVTSVSTQADAPCLECEKRKALIPHRGLRRFFWEPLKCLFQLFAIVCFLGAVSLLYGVSGRGRVRCDRGRGATPWRWFDAQDVMDLLLRIEYTAEVPM